MSSAIWNAMPRLRPKRPSAPPDPSEQAASNSLPVLSAQRSRYAATGVSGSLRWRRCMASPRARQSEASASTATGRTSPSAASSAKAREKR